MSAWVQPLLEQQAHAGGRLGVIVLAERPAGARGLTPLAANESAGRAEELSHALRKVLRAPSERGAPGLAPLAVAGHAPAGQGTVVLRNLGGLMASVDPRGLDRLMHTNGVRKVIAIPELLPLILPLRYRVAAPADLRTGPTPALRRMGVPALWDLGLRGQGMKIAHFDTGINAAHPAFGSLRAAGRLRYAAFDRLGQQLPGARPRDQILEPFTFHGTHTAGTLVGGEVDGTAIGVAPEASLISVQIFPKPRPRSPVEHGELVVQALDWILGEQPDVVNLSFGENGYNDTFLGVIEDIVRVQRIPVVAAIGNGGRGLSCSPGNYSQVISVGAVDASNRIPSFSGSSGGARRARPDISAPGMAIVSAGRGADMAVSDGTSMAAPHVAGLLALARQKNRRLSPAQLKRLLKETAKVPANWDPERGGAGVIDGRQLVTGL
jgi:subtilisin family serine protease